MNKKTAIDKTINKSIRFVITRTNALNKDFQIKNFVKMKLLTVSNSW